MIQSMKPAANGPLYMTMRTVQDDETEIATPYLIIWDNQTDTATEYPDIVRFHWPTIKYVLDVGTKNLVPGSKSSEGGASTQGISQPTVSETVLVYNGGCRLHHHHAYEDDGDDDRHDHETGAPVAGIGYSFRSSYRTPMTYTTRFP
ncbi:hypothetical protein WOLCODRAFT_16126 [Wolfiporia cocos MD-104 SS10]|uniref:Uncharacterized protein n=1 Tax=Wolfiporia cocos (strain MD-104) TaxID=742152 RepID=A0A2H3JC67_WOLCO|nr:hypothetical protein WOLCODRAFT_16126 [Wolfiporia cocos MD-104 SS10]